MNNSFFIVCVYVWQNLQDDLKSLQDQLEQTTDACQLLLTETGAQNSQLIKQALSDIGHRLATLENEFKKREQALSERNRRHRDFQVKYWSHNLLSNNCYYQPVTDQLIAPHLE